MKTFLLIVSCFILLSCEDRFKTSDPVKKDSFTVLTTADYFYSSDPTEVVLYNRTSDAALIESCEKELLFLRDRKVDGTWKLWYQASCSNQVEFLAIPAGSNYKESIYVSKPGVYRYRFVVFFSGKADPDTVYSNSFSIE